MTLEDAVAVDEPDDDIGLNPVHSTAEPFEICVQVTPGRCEMVLSGELDVFTAPLLRHRMAEMSDELGTELVLDIGAVTFIDSTGLSLLVSQHKKLKAHGAELVVRSPTRMALRLFAISGLDSVLTIRTAGDDA
jgi:anti-sigma B factor antagonist